jgi:hypothetical protein
MSRRKSLVFHPRSVLATSWFDGPIEGYLVTESEIYRFDMFRSVMAGPDGIYDERWHIFRRLVASPEEVGLKEARGLVKPWGEEDKPLFKRLDAIPKEEGKLWLRTVENWFRGPVRLRPLGSSFDLDLAISIRSKRKLARYLMRCRPR